MLGLRSRVSDVSAQPAGQIRARASAPLLLLSCRPTSDSSSQHKHHPHIRPRHERKPARPSSAPARSRSRPIASPRPHAALSPASKSAVAVSRPPSRLSPTRSRPYHNGPVRCRASRPS